MDDQQRPNGIPVTRFTLQSIYAQSDDEKLEFDYESGNMSILVFFFHNNDCWRDLSIILFDLDTNIICWTCRSMTIHLSQIYLTRYSSFLSFWFRHHCCIRLWSILTYLCGPSKKKTLNHLLGSIFLPINVIHRMSHYIVAWCLVIEQNKSFILAISDWPCLFHFSPVMNSLASSFFFVWNPWFWFLILGGCYYVIISFSQEDYFYASMLIMLCLALGFLVLPTLCIRRNDVIDLWALNVMFLL